MALQKQRGEKMSEKKFTANDMKISSLEQAIVTINETLIRFEKRFDKIDMQLAQMNSRIWSTFMYTIGAFAVTWAIMAHGFHWF